MFRRTGMLAAVAVVAALAMISAAYAVDPENHNSSRSNRGQTIAKPGNPAGAGKPQAAAPRTEGAATTTTKPRTRRSNPDGSY